MVSQQYVYDPRAIRPWPASKTSLVSQPCQFGQESDVIVGTNSANHVFQVCLNLAKLNLLKHKVPSDCAVFFYLQPYCCSQWRTGPPGHLEISWLAPPVNEDEAPSGQITITCMKYHSLYFINHSSCIAA